MLLDLVDLSLLLSGLKKRPATTVVVKDISKTCVQNSNMTMDIHLMINAINRGTATIPLIVALTELVTTTPATFDLCARDLTYRSPVTMIVPMFNGLRES